jgi:cellulose synthase (UDP-forming)
VRRAVSAVAIAGGFWYLGWRLTTLSGTGALGLLFYVAEAVTFGLLVVSAVLTARVRAPRPPPGPPFGTLDVFVTVCGEPLELVEPTLRAALAIEYPHRTYVLNDGLVAGKADWEEVDRLAARLGIPCLTRTGGGRGKAANLNHALRRTSGEFVATIDADHVAEPDFAAQTLGYFADERVAFVASSQRFVAGRDVLNNQEHFFYEWLQPAKDLDSSAFSCGNGTIYRRAARDTHGGFSEWNVVEDLHTSYLLHAGGWRSVYHQRPLTLGTAPKSPSVFLKQRMRWAMDSARLLFWDSPIWKRGLTGIQRVHYLHTTSFYPLTSLQVLLMLGAPLYVFGRISLVNAPTGEYLEHAIPYFLGILAFLSVHGGPGGAFRIMQSTVFAACGYVIATVLAALRVPPESSPTEKGRQRWFSPLLLPPLLLLAVLVASVAYTAVDTAPGRSAVAVFWATFLSILLIGPMTALGDRPRLEQAARGLGRFGLVLGAALLLVLDLIPAEVSGTSSDPCAGKATTLVAVHYGPTVQPADAPLEPPRSGAYFGASAPGLADCGNALERLSGELGHELAIVHWYEQWRSGAPEFPAARAVAVAQRSAVPMISWEPWGGDQGSAVRLEDIAKGRLDGYLRAWARDAADFGRPLLIRPMHAMNGNWFPWAVTAPGNSPRLYVRAWRRMHRLFTDEGADNVTWVWSVSSFAGLPEAGGAVDASYPGAAYVDWVGVSAFNWGTAQSPGAWRAPEELVGATYTTLERYRKPVMVTEIGTVAWGGDAARWVEQAMRLPGRSHARLGAVVWFGHRLSERADFRLRGETLSAMRTALDRAPWTRRP